MDTSKQLLHRATQRSVKVIMAIALTALLTTSLAVSAFLQAGPAGHGRASDGWASDVRALVRDPLAYFSQRSPGVRSSRDLVQLKHRMFKSAERRVKPPHEQVLANVRYPSAIPDFLNDVLAPVTPDLFEQSGPAPSFSAPGPGVGTTGIPSGIVPVNSGSGSSGTGTSGGVTAVPEPATWLTLILGMALAGIGLRSKRRYLAKAQARSGDRAHP